MKMHKAEDTALGNSEGNHWERNMQRGNHIRYGKEKETVRKWRKRGGTNWKYKKITEVTMHRAEDGKERES